MTMIDLYTSRQEAAGVSAGGRPPRRIAPARWLVATVLLLGASAGVRAWQDRRYDIVSAGVPPLPFALKELPDTLGTWKLIPGEEHALDPQIARIAGADDHLVRSYADAQTGAVVSVMISYGNGQALFAHVPEVCYPGAGYGAAADVSERPIPTSRGPVPFKSMVFTREGGAAPDREEAYYSFRHEGTWTPDAAARWKEFRLKPALFKVQAQRRLGPQERRLIDNPTEQLLASFVSALEARLAGQPGAPPSAAAPASAPDAPGRAAPPAAK